MVPVFPPQVVLVYNSSEEHLMPVPGAAVHWLDGNKPLDVPVCGFKNDNPKCLTSQWMIGPNTGPNAAIQTLEQ